MRRSPIHGEHRLGIRENWPQFSLLVLINACVGGMVGLERTVVPLVATQEFHLTSDTLIFSFIVAFGLVKAFSNVASGMLADRFSRKAMLVSGWLIGLPVPFMLAWGPSWTWIVLANVLLGASQGFTWSMTVIMKNDLVGTRQRGLAMGLNEFAGYGGLGIPILDPPSAKRTMFGVCQAGLVNNLNDGISWGVLPLLFAAHDLAIDDIGIIKAVYPLTWSVGQLGTGALADRVGRRPLIMWGMIVQALALALIGFGAPSAYTSGIAGAVLLGLGTAMVYPALLAAAADISPAAKRATTLGWYRFWRDLGYPAGALLAGIVSATFGLVWAIYLAGFLTFASGVIAALSMIEKRSDPSGFVRPNDVRAKFAGPLPERTGEAR